MTAHLTPEDLAARWRRRPAWVRQQANAGLIPGIKIGRWWRFREEDIDAYERRHLAADPLSMTPGAATRDANRARAS